MNRKNKDLKLFEIAKLYSKADPGKGYSEVPAVSLGMTGLVRENWLDAKRKVTLFDVKGIVESMLVSLGLEAEFAPREVTGLAVSAGVKIKGSGEIAGFIGAVSRRILKSYDIEEEVFVSQIELPAVVKKAVLSGKYSPIPRFPFSTRDISILSDKGTPAGDMLSHILGVGGELVRGADLIDMYEGKNIPQDKRSLTFSIKYGLATRTLTDDEITKAHDQIKNSLASTFGVSFR